MFYEFNHLGSPNYMKIERGNDFSFPLHLHRCFEIIIILSGMMKVTIDNKTFLCGENDALIIFPNQIHSLESSKSEHILCIFSPDMVQAYATKIVGKVPENNCFHPDEYFVNALKNISEVPGIAQKKGLLYSLCGEFEKTAQYQCKNTEDEKLLYRIFAFVEEKFNEECTLKTLSDTVGYNYTYLSRFFKKAVGFSFNAYVNHYRLSHACYLLNNSNLSILQCALESGYDSIRSFNRNFKTQFQITPAQYRLGNQKLSINRPDFCEKSQIISFIL